MSLTNTDIAKNFLNGTGPDAKGRYIYDYLAFSLDAWEDCHDHIQWAFPSSIPSEFNADAPVVSLFHLTRSLNEHGIRNAYFLITRYLASIGIGVNYTVHDSVAWLLIHNQQSRMGWISPCDHNHRRLTRLLQFMHHMYNATNIEIFNPHGLITLLMDIALDSEVCFSVKTLAYWTLAAKGELK